jgi:PleD family two-component response regulator
MPWGISFAVLCALAGGLLGRIRRTNAALRQSAQKYRRLSTTDESTGLYNTRYFFR